MYSEGNQLRNFCISHLLYLRSNNLSIANKLKCWLTNNANSYFHMLGILLKPNYIFLCNYNKLSYWHIFRILSNFQGNLDSYLIELCNYLCSRNTLYCLTHHKCYNLGHCKCSICSLCSGKEKREVCMSNTLSVSHSHIYHMDSNTKCTYQNPVPAHSHIQCSNVHFIANNLHNHYHIISKSYHQVNNMLSCMKYIKVSPFLIFYTHHNSMDMVYNFYFHLRLAYHHILHIN